MSAIKVKDMIRKLEANGWQLVRINGSHRIFKNSVIGKTTVVAGKESDDIPKMTEKQIYKQTGLK
ncbi:MAG: type II toxin-antitoxin system HicA family toxin [Candidatus Kapabacteria bacterium]|jgi:predicted RNA binding protein YcfA (HicA-like mRNA interferase family)|nr:type II toxin-antitoxin system HicA family toxin [Candidatus Kapabacteria bacterium]